MDDNIINGYNFLVRTLLEDSMKHSPHKSQDYIWKIIIILSTISSALYLYVDYINSRPFTTIPVLIFLILMIFTYNFWINSKTYKILLNLF
jgi:hypothetical protein